MPVPAPTPGGLDAATFVQWGGYFGLFCLGAWTAFKGFNKGKQGEAPAGQSTLVAAALGTPASLATDLGHVKDTLSRIERHIEGGNRLTDENGDRLDEMLKVLRHEGSRRFDESEDARRALIRLDEAMERKP